MIIRKVKGKRREMWQGLTFGVKRHAMHTRADKLIVTDIEVILSGTVLAVAKYNGTNASQMMQVVYIVKPICFDSLKASGIFLVSTA